MMSDSNSGYLIFDRSILERELKAEWDKIFLEKAKNSRGRKLQVRRSRRFGAPDPLMVIRQISSPAGNVF